MAIFNKMKKWFQNEEEKKENLLFPNKLISVENNQIFVQETLLPTVQDSDPIIFIPSEPNLIVEINNEKAFGYISLTGDEMIEVKILNPIVKEANVHLQTVVSDDKLTVSIQKTFEAGFLLSLKDNLPSKEVTLELVEKETFPPPVSIDLIKEKIDEYKFVGNLVNENLELLSSSNEEIELVVLQAINGVEGIPAFYEQIFFPIKYDFVSSGIKIANFKPEVPPQYGKDVYGNELITPFEYSLPILGENVELKEGKLISKKDGKLIFSDKEIEVIPQLTIPGDISGEDGPLIFNDGDIIVEGKILEHSFVQASGTITAKNGIYGATIFSGQGLLVNGNISTSHVYVGYQSFLYKRLFIVLEPLLTYLSAHQYHHFAEESKSKPLKELRKLYETIERHLPDYLISDYVLFWQSVDSIYPICSLTKEEREEENNQKKLSHILEKLIDLQKKISLLTFKDAPVVCDNITNSFLYSYDKIEVKGEGTYLSFIESTDSIKVLDKIRGGTLIAQKSIEAKEFKSFNSTDYGLIVIDENGYVKLGKRFPDTTIKIGSFSTNNEKLESNVHFKLSKEQKNSLK